MRDDRGHVDDRAREVATAWGAPAAPLSAEAELVPEQQTNAKHAERPAWPIV